MHPRNHHQHRYDLQKLVLGTPELKPYIILNPLKLETIDFGDSRAVKILNKAILKDIYGITYWDIPDNFLCPPVPGRADYLHYLADLIGEKKDIYGLDIGTGANCIYPLIGHKVYGWKFTGTEINQEALNSAEKIITENNLSEVIDLRLQTDSKSIFKGIIKPEDKFEFSMCNPPFHSSAEEALAGTQRKWKNLGLKNKGLNFGGQSNELWCEGGEKVFITKMIEESAQYKNNCKWFTSLVSKEDNLLFLRRALKKCKCPVIKVIEMTMGQKRSRFLAWSFIP